FCIDAIGYDCRGIAVRLPRLLVAAGVSESARRCRLRSTVPDHLGEEHVRLGFRSLQISARTDLLRSCGWSERSMVRRQQPVNTVAREEARCEPPASHHEAG